MRNFYYISSDKSEENDSAGANSTFITKQNFQNFPTDSFTISVWVKCTENATQATLISYNEFTDPDEAPDHNSTRFLVSDLSNLQIWYDSSSCTTNVSVADGKWHHLAISITFPNQESVQAEIFKDGNSQGVWQIYRDQGIKLPASSTLNFGVRYPDTASESLTGLVSQFQLWKYARTGEQIRSDMFLPMPRDLKDLVVYWTLDQDNIDPGRQLVIDRSANHNNGTIYNSHRAIWKSSLWVDLSNQDFSGRNLDGADLFWAVLQGTKLKDASLQNANLQNAKLDRATLNNTNLTNAQMQGTSFDDTDITSTKFSKPPAFSTDPNNRTTFFGARLDYNLLGNVWSYLDLSEAVFVNLPADLSNLQAVYTVLRNFSQLGHGQLKQANFNNANLTGANLSYANLTSATLQDAILYATALSYSTLDGADFLGAQLGSQQTVFTLDLSFQGDLDRGQISSDLKEVFAQNALSLKNPVLTIRISGQDWLITDGSDKYNIVKGDKVLTVLSYLATDHAAVLSNALMRNAVFTNANLYAVNLSGVQWYGSNAKADGANLEEADLANATLGSMNLAQAKLYGVTLDNSILVNTSLKGARMTPSATHKQTSLVSASLQGADFTEAQLGNAVLTNAAIAFDTGVPLFQLSSKFSRDLDAGNLSSELTSAFSHNGYNLDAAATLDQAKTKKGSRWAIQNGSGNPNSLGRGYATFILIKTNTSLQVYGSSLWVTQVDDDGELETVQLTYQNTQLTANELNGQTTCPNGEALSYQVRNGLTWEQMMTAKTPPAPPACAGDPNQWCP